jgi:hypothetical protein
MIKQIIISLMLLSNMAYAYSSENCFPENNRILSPSHNYMLTWQKRINDADSHRLLYQNNKTISSSSELLRFDRAVCIHWSPDEKYFTVSDYLGSNVADVYIYKADNIAERIDVMDILPADVSRLFEGSLHSYIETTAWTENALIIRAWGDRESKPRSFDIKLKCNLINSTWTCKK